MNVSIIVPVYNQPEKLNRLLAYYSGCEDINLIVVDDHSHLLCAERHKNICVEYGAKYYFLDKNQGPSTVRFVGLSKSFSKYVLFLDTDDLFPISSLKISLSLLHRDDELSYITCQSSRVPSDIIDDIASNKDLYDVNGEYTYRILKSSFLRSIFEIIGYPTTCVSGWNQSNTIYKRDKILEVYNIWNLTWAEDIPLKVQVASMLHGAALLSDRTNLSLVEISNGRGYKYGFVKILMLAKTLLFLTSNRVTFLGLVRFLCVILRFTPSMLYKKLLS
ncbi:glycosyltransferase family A protein [Aeromonas veronii]|uniref:glycosyltransferase family A protein n=1 Tax=Aeromonas veronii TaxID=654 RepID=UPI0038D26979